MKKPQAGSPRETAIASLQIPVDATALAALLSLGSVNWDL
jgi:hypothetical protein